MAVETLSCKSAIQNVILGRVESVIREVKEETGLTIKSPKLVGMKHWYTTDDERYLVFLYRTSDFEGDLRSTEEGEVRWVAREEVVHMDLAYDMLNLLRVFEEDNLSELFYRERLENDFLREFWWKMNYLFKWMNSFF